MALPRFDDAGFGVLVTERVASRRTLPQRRSAMRVSTTESGTDSATNEYWRSGDSAQRTVIVMQSRQEIMAQARTYDWLASGSHVDRRLGAKATTAGTDSPASLHA
jgi:hypothetical protein